MNDKIMNDRASNDIIMNDRHNRTATRPSSGRMDVHGVCDDDVSPASTNTTADDVLCYCAVEKHNNIDNDGKYNNMGVMEKGPKKVVVVWCPVCHSALQADRAVECVSANSTGTLRQVWDLYCRIPICCIDTRCNWRGTCSRWTLHLVRCDYRKHQVLSLVEKDISAALRHNSLYNRRITDLLDEYRKCRKPLLDIFNSAVDAARLSRDGDEEFDTYVLSILKCPKIDDVPSRPLDDRKNIKSIDKWIAQFYDVLQTNPLQSLPEICKKVDQTKRVSQLPRRSGGCTQPLDADPISAVETEFKHKSPVNDDKPVIIYDDNNNPSSSGGHRQSLRRRRPPTSSPRKQFEQPVHARIEHKYISEDDDVIIVDGLSDGKTLHARYRESTTGTARVTGGTVSITSGEESFSDDEGMLSNDVSHKYTDTTIAIRSDVSTKYTDTTIVKRDGQSGKTAKLTTKLIVQSRDSTHNT